MSHIDGTLFAEVMTSFPTGVAVITSVGPEGDPGGLTSNAVASVSMDPPTLLVCVAKTSRTLPILRQARGFVVNFMAEGAEEVCRTFASKLSAAEKFASVHWSATRSGRPWLHSDSVAFADCITTEEVEASTHLVLIGQVVDAAVTDPGRSPLAYVRRTYRRWPDFSTP